jgi:hypothetical protein
MGGSFSFPNSLPSWNNTKGFFKPVGNGLSRATSFIREKAPKVNNMRRFGSKIGNIGHSIGSVDKTGNISKTATRFATGVANQIIRNEVQRIIVPTKKVIQTPLSVSINNPKSTTNNYNNKLYSNKLKSQPQEPQPLLQQEQVIRGGKKKTPSKKEKKPSKNNNILFQSSDM